MWNQKLMWVVWPAFLAACILELVVFAMVDPQDLHWGGRTVPLSRQGVYTVSFFVFSPLEASCIPSAKAAMPCSRACPL